MKSEYIHGVHTAEQKRLRVLNNLTNPAFLDFVKVKEGDSVLELGSGLGIIANEVAKRNPHIRITGIEYAQEQIEQCEKSQPNLNFIQGDAHQLPFEDNSFDVVYGRYILEHLSSPKQTLKEVYRVLKPKGRVYFQENTNSLQRVYPDCSAYDFVWKQFLNLYSKLGSDADIGKKLYSYLKETGFINLKPSFAEEIHYPEKGTLVPWLENMIGNIESGAEKMLELQLVTKDQLKTAIEELKALQKNELASAYFYWNRIEGEK